MTTRRDGRRCGIVGFSICPRYLGAAVLDHDSPPSLRPTRILRHAEGRAEQVRLRAWAERLIVKSEGKLVALVTDERERLEHLGSMVREVAERHGLAFLEVTRAEVARALNLRESTNAAICSRLTELHPAVAEDLRRKGVRSFRGPRSEALRYWTTPLLAFGATVCAVHFISQTMPPT